MNKQPHEWLDAWKNHQQSLTDKLNIAAGEAHLTVLSQQWQSTGWWDKYMLRIHDNTVFCREILMAAHGIYYWYARTIIPEQSYQANPHFFARLEQESIKNLIFNEPKVQRLEFKVYPINRDCIEFFWVKKHLEPSEKVLWLRLSTFVLLGQYPFYLVEILLPELGCLI
jgi:chorismate-pyruvate lyase